MSQRLCEVKDEMGEAIMALPHSESLTKTKWSLLECPHGRAHCDKSRPCSGMTAENKMRIAQLEDRLFVAGFVQIET